MTMATRLAVMDHGRLRQVGTPGEVYEYPNSRFTAEFLGTANILDGVLEPAGEGARLRCAAPGLSVLSDAPPPKAPGSPAHAAIRPERMRIERAAEGAAHGDNRAIGRVRDIAYFGDFFLFHVATPEGVELRVTQPNLRRVTERPVDWDDLVAVSWDRQAAVVLPE